MIKRLLIFLALAVGTMAAQGAQRIAQATTNDSGVVTVVSGAYVTVCSYPACSPVNLYQNVGLSVSSSNPVVANANGNYMYYVTPGTYIESVFSPGTGTHTVVVTLGGVGGVGTCETLGASAGDVCYYNGANWVILSGNESTILCLSETSGVPSWHACGSGGSVGGSGTTNNMAMWTAATTIGNANPVVSTDGTTWTISAPTTISGGNFTVTDGVGQRAVIAEANGSYTSYQSDHSTIAIPYFGGAIGTGTVCGSGILCLWESSDNLLHEGSGGSDLGALVTGVTGVAPIASTLGATPAISLQNSAASNVTTAYGTDTAYFTASGGPSTLGDAIVGDGNGGIKDSGQPLALSTVGGIVGGLFWNVNAGVEATIGLFAENNSFSSGFRTVTPTNGFLSGLHIVTLSTSPANATTFSFFSSNLSSFAGDPIYGAFRLTIPPGAAAGVFTEPSGISPYPMIQGVNISLAVSTFSATNSSADLGAWSANVVGTTAQPLVGQTNGSVGTGVTRFYGPGNYTLGSTTENVTGVIIPFAGTLKNFCVETGSTQDAAGTFVSALRLTHSGTTTTTALTTTFQEGDSENAYCDTTHTVSNAAGDWIDFQHKNNGTTDATSMESTSVELDPTAPATGMLIFGAQGVTLGSPSYTTYLPAFGGANFGTTATEANAHTAMPRAATLRHLYCLATAVASSGSATAKLVKNGSATTLAVTITSPGSGVSIFSDLTHSVSFNAGDTLDLQFAQASGNVPAVSSCTVEVD